MTPKDACSLLNGLLACDRYAVTRLVYRTIPCLPCVAHHPTVQVQEINGNHLVGFLGVLNGMFLASGEDIVAGCFEAGQLVRFETKTKEEVGL